MEVVVVGLQSRWVQVPLLQGLKISVSLFTQSESLWVSDRNPTHPGSTDSGL